MTEIADLVNEEVAKLREEGVADLPNDFGQAVQAAKCYLDQYKTDIRRDGGQPRGWLHPNWPRTWDRSYWQPESSDPQRNLIRGMALLQLELERRQQIRQAIRPSATATST